MSAIQKPQKTGTDGAPQHRIRITLTSRNVRNLEKGTNLQRSVLGVAPGGDACVRSGCPRLMR